MIAQAPPDSSDVAGWREEIARIDQRRRSCSRRTRSRRTRHRAVAGRAMQLGLERNAVSGGDVWMLDKASGVLASGDLVTLPAPLLDTACADGWREASRRLDAIGFTMLVPGHGAPMTMRRFTRIPRRVRQPAWRAPAGKAPEAQCRAAGCDDAGALIPPGDAALADSLLDYYIGQVLRAPTARRLRYCHDRCAALMARTRCASRYARC